MKEVFNKTIWVSTFWGLHSWQTCLGRGDQLPTSPLFRRYGVHGEEFGRLVGTVLLLTIFALSGRTPSEGAQRDVDLRFPSMHPTRSLCLSIQLDRKN